MKDIAPCTIVCGPPGSGKSTYVAANRQRDDMVVDVDALFAALTGLGEREHPQWALPFVLAARAAVIHEIARGFLGPRMTWVIMGGEDNDARADLRRRLNADVIVLPVPAGECVARMRKQGRPEAHIREVEPVCVKWGRLFVAAPGEVIPDRPMSVGEDGWPAH